MIDVSRLHKQQERRKIFNWIVEVIIDHFQPFLREFKITSQSGIVRTWRSKWQSNHVEIALFLWLHDCTTMKLEKE